MSLLFSITEAFRVKVLFSITEAFRFKVLDLRFVRVCLLVLETV